MDWRIVACAGLILVASVAGCFDPTPNASGSRLAQPTAQPVLVPIPTNATNATPPPVFGDIGYILDPDWHVGDEWHYISNQSNFRLVRVASETFADGERKLIVEELGGRLGNPPRYRALSYIDTQTMARHNFTYLTGVTGYEWSPSNPSEFYLKNGTFGFNETESRHGADIGRVALRTNSYFAGYVEIDLFWGKVTTGRVEHRTLRTDASGNSARELIVHYPYREYGADAQYEQPNGEFWGLKYLKYGALEKGDRVTW